MAIWFPSKKDIKAAKLELKKDDAIAIHRPTAGRDFQAPLGESLDQRYAPLDHSHGTGDHDHDEEYAKVDHDHDDIKQELQIHHSLISQNGQKLGKLQTDLDNHNHDDKYLQLSGGTLTNALKIQKGDKDGPQWKISPNGGSDYATSIYSFNGGQMRFGTTPTAEEKGYTSHIILDPNNGSPQTKIYKVPSPTQADNAANKQYVDDEITKASSDHLPLSGGTCTGKVEIIRPSGVAFEIKKTGSALRDTSGLKIWPDGSCETTKTDFDDNHLVTSQHVKDTYSAKGHKHTTGDNVTFGPARYTWEYKKQTDPGDYQITIDTANNYLRLACIPLEPKLMWKVTATHQEELPIDAMWSIYEYEYKSNATSHRRYNYKMIACGKTNLVKYYAKETGYFNRFQINHWYKTPGNIADGTKLWCTIAGLA